ncbi:serine/threonine-protein kinase [Streptomyces sp. NRRL F-5123]|uniref:serine/threonine-protein kinase n=1 Tax=Streptomyces sp. NRRL F-5123 TaxID=1463856 RepID=UPI0006933257|nr:serine/threonine-protein kinase [Streptomyces sp. NRRL F-5123]
MGAQHTGGHAAPGYPGHPGPLYQPLAPDDPAAIGGHRVAARLGVGSLGPVYLAYAPAGHPVALTAVRPELAARAGFAAAFEHDVQAVRRVSGPYTVPVLGSGHDGTRYWLAAGYVPALTLHAAVSDTGRPLPVPTVLRLVAGVAEALRAVHHAGVVHAGLGPGTVLLAADGPRVTGYGVTRAAADAPGIPAFSSPEQAADKAPVPATDVFALGQLAAYAAIGTAPFDPDTGRKLAEEPDLNELPGELREIVTRCLIKDPALRPSPAQVVAMCAQAGHGRRPDPWLPVPLQTLLTLPPPLPPLPPPGTWPTVPSPAPPPAATGGAPADPGAVPGAPGAASASAPQPPNAGSPAAPFPPGATPAGGVAVPPGGPNAGSPAAPFPPGATPAGGVAVPPQPVVPPGATPAGGTPVPPAPPGAVPPAPVPPQQPVPVHAGATPAAGTVVLPPTHSAPVPPPPAAPLPPQPPAPPGATPAHGVPVFVPPPAGHTAPVPAGKRRGGGPAVWIALAAAVAGGVIVAGRFGKDGSADHSSASAVPHSTAPSQAPGGGAPSPSPSPSPTGDAPAPGGGGQRDYLAVTLHAGQALDLTADPLRLQEGADTGTFGYDGTGDALVAAPSRSSLVLLAPQEAGTRERCSAAQGDTRVQVLPRAGLVQEARLCVVGTDGTVALVTVRSLSPAAGPDGYATLDLSVWPAQRL